MRKWVIFCLLAAVAGAGAVGLHSGYVDVETIKAAFASKKSDAPAAGRPSRMDPVAVEAATVTAGKMTTRITALGTLQADQSVVIQPEIAGKVVRVGFREGEKVKAGTVLVELDRSILAAEQQQAKSALDLAEVNYRRADTLSKQGIGTTRSRDEAVMAYQTAVAENELTKARLQKTTIVAPFDGVVGLSDVTIGRFLNVGDRIVNLESIDPLKVDFRVPELFLPALRIGQGITLTIDAYPGRSFEGKVYAIDPLVDVNGRAVKLRARVTNADGALKPGLFARIELTTDSRNEAVLVPEAALIPQGPNRFVYRVDGDKVVYVKVELGERRAGIAEIRSGLKPGDRVVTAGQLKLFDGAPVEIRVAAEKATRG